MPDHAHIAAAMPADVQSAVDVLAAAFADDPITGFLLQPGPGYRARLTQFFSLLMEARLTLSMPVLVARSTYGIHGAAMGYSPVRPTWPADLSARWDQFEQATPGMTDRMACYVDIAERFKPTQPHHYLGVIGTDPALHGRAFVVHVLGAGTSPIQLSPRRALYGYQTRLVNALDCSGAAVRSARNPSSARLRQPGPRSRASCHAASKGSRSVLAKYSISDAAWATSLAILAR